MAADPSPALALGLKPAHGGADAARVRAGRDARNTRRVRVADLRAEGCPRRPTRREPRSTARRARVTPPEEPRTETDGLEPAARPATLRASPTGRSSRANPRRSSRAPEERAAYERGAASTSTHVATRLSRWLRSRRTARTSARSDRACRFPRRGDRSKRSSKAGDPFAADALLELSQCAVEIPGRGETYRRLRDSGDRRPGSPADAAFVHGALDTELLGMANDAPHVLRRRPEPRTGSSGSRSAASPRGRGPRIATRGREPARVAWTITSARFRLPEVPRVRHRPATGNTSVPRPARCRDDRRAEWDRFSRDAPLTTRSSPMRVAYCAMSRAAPTCRRPPPGTPADRVHPARGRIRAARRPSAA